MTSAHYSRFLERHLRRQGWYPGRRVEVDVRTYSEDKNILRTMSVPIKFLQEFKDIHIWQRLRNNSVRRVITAPLGIILPRYYFVFEQPWFAYDDMAGYQTSGMDPFFPIGSYSTDCHLAMQPSGEVYMLTDIGPGALDFDAYRLRGSPAEAMEAMRDADLFYKIEVTRRRSVVHYE